MMIKIRTVTGAAMTTWLDEAARLRILVFRDFPYLYDGHIDYERRYLAQFAAAADSALILALADDQVVGCATAMAMRGADADFRRPFDAAGANTDDICYFGESVLDARYRGQGIGHQFFDAREQHARQLGAKVTTFCAVQRPDNHPLRPPGYRPLDAFWHKRGYQRRDDLTTQFTWKDIDQPSETAKSMVFWLRALTGQQQRPMSASNPGG
ncbi:MAG: N-acetyltransferase [Wenzhouxiangellaceae bacterium]|nr:MAG: N-acetyltransferase [Wenzhouxiangellaceae bacterium]